jgi:2,4-dienoyl-CoA reductase-like NADH-dependent reductase (Old Yellow Enzyme family)
VLIREIEKFLRSTGMPASKFGRMAARDPRLVHDLRNGREPRRRMVLRVEHFMNKYKLEMPNAR